jgi:hypothetical protein
VARSSADDDDEPSQEVAELRAQAMQATKELRQLRRSVSDREGHERQVAAAASLATEAKAAARRSQDELARYTRQAESAAEEAAVKIRDLQTQLSEASEERAQAIQAADAAESLLEQQASKLSSVSSDYAALTERVHRGHESQSQKIVNREPAQPQLAVLEGEQRLHASPARCVSCGAVIDVQTIEAVTAAASMEHERALARLQAEHAEVQDRLLARERPRLVRVRLLARQLTRCWSLRLLHEPLNDSTDGQLLTERCAGVRHVCGTCVWYVCVCVCAGVDTAAPRARGRGGGSGGRGGGSADRGCTGSETAEHGRGRA